MPQAQKSSEAMLPFFVNLGILVFRLSEAVSDVCWAPASRVAVLEERVSGLEAIRR